MLALDWILLLIGTLLGIVALTADLIGIGAAPGFGWRQAVATGVALVAVTVGAVRIVRHDRNRAHR